MRKAVHQGKSLKMLVRGVIAETSLRTVGAKLDKVLQVFGHNKIPTSCNFAQ